MEAQQAVAQCAPKTAKRFVNQIPDEILNNVQLNEAMKVLPSHYNFEIHKTVWRIQQMKEEKKTDTLTVCLQFPEGLMMFACLISDLLEAFAACKTVILGDVTYGACCIDDITTQRLGADFLVHYAHSCLVPITDCCTKVLYVFVEISIDLEHFRETVLLNFPLEQRAEGAPAAWDAQDPIYLMGTVQFNTVMFNAKKILTENGYTNVVIPQEKPRSQGEVLGCTSPKLDVREGRRNIMLFIADGRFHMEAAMIANPAFTAYQYNPYTKALTIERYNHNLMKEIRMREIIKSQQQNVGTVGVIFGTLGRQGNAHILKRIEQVLKDKNIDYFVLLVSELNFDQLSLIADSVDFFVQISCPRLSIDWGSEFCKPLLNPYEFFVAMKHTDWREVYPMDYYSNSGGAWTNYFHKQGADKKVRLKYE